MGALSRWDKSVNFVPSPCPNTASRRGGRGLRLGKTPGESAYEPPFGGLSGGESRTMFSQGVSHARLAGLPRWDTREVWGFTVFLFVWGGGKRQRFPFFTL